MATKFYTVAPVICGPPCGTCFMRSALFWDFTPRRMAFLTDVSGQSIPPVFKGQDPFTLEDGLARLSQNAGKELPFYAS